MRVFNAIYGVLLDNFMIVVALGLIGLLCFAALMPMDWHAFDNQGLRTVWIVSSTINQVVVLSAVASAVGLLIFARLATSAPGWLRMAVVPVAIMGFPLAMGVRWFLNLAPYTVEAVATGSDGRTYAFLDSSFLQGQVLALAVIEDDVSLWTRYHVIGTTNGDNPRRWASIVRPAGAPIDYGQFYWSADGTLYGVRSEHECYFSYNISSRAFLAREEILSTSPFVLIEQATPLEQRDVAAISKLIQTDDIGRSGVPDRLVLNDALTHDNPAVRALARDWLVQIDSKAARNPAGQ